VHHVNSSAIRLFHLKDFPEFIYPPAYKKSGISLGVSLANHEWIVVSDADCTHGAEWLQTIAYAIESSNNLFFTAPILLSDGNHLITKMQQTENQAFMVVTAAGIRSALHDIANGANMAFAKSAFINVNGYEGNYHFASGDDMFLIEKMRKKIGDRIGFVKSIHAAANTVAKENWSSLISQRIRWAGKNKGLERPVIHIIWSFIGLYHVLLFIYLCLALCSLTSIWPFLILFIPKLVIDFVLIKAGADFLNQKISVFLFIPLQVLYTFYILYLGIHVMLRKKGDWEEK
ncbi:MAG: glycosyltransferase, partial [Saprospiraceae bacterium]